jgi:hypothetical protein
VLQLSRQLGRGVMAVTMNFVLSVPEMCCPVRQENVLSCPSGRAVLLSVRYWHSPVSQGGRLFCQPRRGAVLPVRKMCSPVSQGMVLSCLSVWAVSSQPRNVMGSCQSGRRAVLSIRERCCTVLSPQSWKVLSCLSERGVSCQSGGGVVMSERERL